MDHQGGDRHAGDGRTWPWGGPFLVPRPFRRRANERHRRRVDSVDKRLRGTTLYLHRHGSALGVLVRCIRRAVDGAPRRRRTNSRCGQSGVELPSKDKGRDFLVVLFRTYCLLQINGSALFFRVVPSSRVESHVDQVQQATMSEGLTRRVRDQVRVRPRGVQVWVVQSQVKQDRPGLLRLTRGREVSFYFRGG